MLEINAIDLGHYDYQSAWDLQIRIQQTLIQQKRNRQKGIIPKKKINDVLLIVEHPHVYTLGKSGSEANLLADKNELKSIAAEYIRIDRGGDITYHGPGQLVVYPILDLYNYFSDIHRYLRTLEEVVILTLADFGIAAGRIDNLTGVWIGDEKMCAMGVKCSRWVTMHGFALNVNTDLSYFNHIIPCGILDKKVTSMSKILNKEINMDDVKKTILKHFSTEFKVEPILLSKLPSLYS